jgi:hypothetical protein
MPLHRNRLLRQLTGAVSWSSVSKALFYLACLATVFTSGIGVGRYQVFPYPLLEYGKEALDDVVWEAAVSIGLRPTEHAAPSRYGGAGVTTNTEARRAPGLTLLTGFFDGRNELRLVRADGSVVRRWTPSFFEAFRSTDHIAPRALVPKSELNVEIHGAVALPDGSVVFNYDGKGTIKLDRCGVLQWTVPRMNHHAVSRSEDGGFWIPSFRYIDRDSRYPAIPPPYLEPTVLKVGPDGAVRQELSILDLFFRNDLASLLFANGLKGIALANKYEGGTLPNDLVHLNDVDELPASMAQAFPQFRPGSLLLSLRDYNLIMVADPARTSVEWYRVGPWIGQHDPDFLASGRISVLDNNNDGTDTGSLLGGSRIIEIDPSTNKSTVRYGDLPGQRLYTDIMGQHQHLGGNLLIAETRAGRVLEVTDQGEVVWEFINRVDPATVNAITGAARYSDGYFTVTDWTCR